MKKYDKNCKYCNQKFTSKRIDAKYCSGSCRTMASREDNDPEIYLNDKSIHFEICAYEFNLLDLYAKSRDTNPHDLIKKICIEKVLDISINWNGYE